MFYRQDLQSHWYNQNDPGEVLITDYLIRDFVERTLENRGNITSKIIISRSIDSIRIDLNLYAPTDATNPQSRTLASLKRPKLSTPEISAPIFYEGTQLVNHTIRNKPLHWSSIIKLMEEILRANLKVHNIYFRIYKINSLLHDPTMIAKWLGLQMVYDSRLRLVNATKTLMSQFSGSMYHHDLNQQLDLYMVAKWVAHCRIGNDRTTRPNLISDSINEADDEILLSQNMKLNRSRKNDIIENRNNELKLVPYDKSGSLYSRISHLGAIPNLPRYVLLKRSLESALCYNETRGRFCGLGIRLAGRIGNQAVGRAEVSILKQGNVKYGASKTQFASLYQATRKGVMSMRIFLH